MRRTTALIALALLLLAGGCAVSSQQQSEAERAAEAVATAATVPVARVTRVEVGAIHRGVMVSAHGETDGGGWQAARLVPRRSVDGALEFDMVAVPPQAGATQGPQRLRADRPVESRDLDGVSEIRVHGAQTVASVAAPARE